MAWRKWLVRGLVYACLGLLVLGAVLYQVSTNPATVRRLLLETLSARLPGAVVTVDSAHLRLLGGTEVRDLRLARREELDHGDFLYAPSAVIYHDKERLLAGDLVIRKIELQRPRLRLVRNRDGRWNVAGLTPPDRSLPTERLPLLVVQMGTLVLEDQALSPSPLLEIRDVQLTARNDPLPIVEVDAVGTVDSLGPVRVHGRLDRSGGLSSVRVELNAIPIGPTLVQRLATLCPDFAAQLRQFNGSGSVRATLTFQDPPHHAPGGDPGGTSGSEPVTFHYDVTAGLKDATFSHARLPFPLRQVEASLRCVDGHVPHAHVTGRDQDTRITFDVRDLVLPHAVPDSLDDLADSYEWSAEHLTLTPELFALLPPTVNVVEDYRPSGVVSFHYRFAHEPGAGAPAGARCWRKTWTLQPEGISSVFCKFPYPVQQVTGTIENTRTSAGLDRTTVDLHGLGGGVPVAVAGTIEGMEHAAVDLAIRAERLPLDETLLKALPAGPQALAARFHLSGRIDVAAAIHRARGAEDFVNRYTLTAHDLALCYDDFPCPLDHASGVLDILPDHHWEVRNFVGHHAGGEIRANGRNFPLPAMPGGEPTSRIDLTIQGSNVVLDRQLEEALAPPSHPERRQMQQTVQSLRVGGPLAFTVHVIDVPNQPQELDLTVSLRNCTLRPKFFDCPLTEVSADAHYGHNRLALTDLHAVHGSTRLSVREGVVLGKPGGGFYARLDGLCGRGLTFDPELTRALPPVLRKGLDGLQLHGPIDLGGALAVDPRYGQVDLGASLVIDPPEGGGPPVIWWDGVVWLHDVRMKAGLELSGLNGVVACTGLFDGQRLQGVVGTALFDRFTVLGQPIRGFQTHLIVPRGEPDVLELRDLKAQVFDGSVGGEGRVEFRSALHYDLGLRASRVRLEEFSRHNLPPGADLQGEVRADLHVTGEGTDLAGLRGHGVVEVPDGKLYKLPFLLDLIKALGLRLPDGTAFEQARVSFALEGPQVRVTDLDLVGNAISLRGGGTVLLDGSDLNLDIHADWARLGYLLPRGLAWLPRGVSDQLLTIKVRGRVGDVKIDKQLVPAVTGLLRPL